MSFSTSDGNVLRSDCSRVAQVEETEVTVYLWKETLKHNTVLVIHRHSLMLAGDEPDLLSHLLKQSLLIYYRSGWRLWNHGQLLPGNVCHSVTLRQRSDFVSIAFHARDGNKSATLLLDKIKAFWYNNLKLNAGGEYGRGG